jgi:BirA family biotin operon repressor/biotin-[acetyl-CoA-carboxylase] ligase
VPAETPPAGPAFDVRWVAETGSTNTDAMALARDGAPEGVVVVADHQTAGRGRLGRSWEAPPGASLLVSVLLRPPAAVLEVVTPAAGLAMAEAVAEVAGVDARLKWPNDLVVDVGGGVERKLAGMLAEADWPAGTSASGGYATPGPTQRVAVVVGIGVNVDWPDDVPPELADVLTACNHVTGRAPDRRVLLERFLGGLGASYARLVEHPDDRTWLLDAYRARSATLGRAVRVDTGSSEVEGTAVDVDQDGRLLVEVEGGGRRTIAVGDVVHLRHRAG